MKIERPFKWVVTSGDSGLLSARGLGDPDQAALPHLSLFRALLSCNRYPGFCAARPDRSQGRFYTLPVPDSSSKHFITAFTFILIPKCHFSLSFQFVMFFVFCLLSLQNVLRNLIEAITIAVSVLYGIK